VIENSEDLRTIQQVYTEDLARWCALTLLVNIILGHSLGVDFLIDR